jgi:hypothetical protein
MVTDSSSVAADSGAFSAVNCSELADDGVRVAQALHHIPRSAAAGAPVTNLSRLSLQCVCGAGITGLWSLSPLPCTLCF